MVPAILHPSLDPLDIDLGSMDLAKAAGRESEGRVWLGAVNFGRVCRQNGDGGAPRVPFMLKDEIEPGKSGVVAPPHANGLAWLQYQRCRPLCLIDGMGNQGAKRTPADLYLFEAAKNTLLCRREGIVGGEERSSRP